MISEIDVLRLRAESAEGGWRMAADEIERLEKQTVFWRNIADNSGDASLARAKEIERLQRENADARGLATDEARCNESLREEIEDLEAKLAAAEAAAMAYQQLSMCYRIGKRPTEKLFKQLENANKVCAAIDAAKTGAKA